MPISPVIMQVAQGGYNILILYVALAALFYLFIFRPQQTQQRRRREMLGKLKKGDRIVTVGGLHATLLDVEGDTLSLELAPNLRVKADRSAVSYVRNRKREESGSTASTPPAS